MKTENPNVLFIAGAGAGFIGSFVVARSNVQALVSNQNFGMYNEGIETQTTINELCELILELKESDLKVKYNPYNEVDSRAMVKNRIGSSVKAEKELGFKYKYELPEYLQKLIELRIATGVDKM